MKHLALQAFGVVFDNGDMQSLWRAQDAIIAAGGLLLSPGSKDGYSTAYLAERSLEAEIATAIGGKPGDRVG